MGVYYNAPPPTKRRNGRTAVVRRNGVTRRAAPARLGGYDSPDLGNIFGNIGKAISKGVKDIGAQAKRSAGDVQKLAPIVAPVLAATGIGLPFAGAIAAGSSLVNRVKNSGLAQAAAQSQAAFRQLSAGANQSPATPLTNALVSMIPAVGPSLTAFTQDANESVNAVRGIARTVKSATDRANAAKKRGDTAAAAAAVQAAKDAATAAARTTAKAKRQAAKILADAQAAADKAAAERAAAQKEEAAAKAAGDTAAAAKAKARQGRAIQAANKAKADAEAATAAAQAAQSSGGGGGGGAMTAPVYNGPAPSSFVAPEAAAAATAERPAGIMDQIRANPLPAAVIVGGALYAVTRSRGMRSWH